MNERVVVVGATGTIGRPLCAELTGRGYGVVVFSRDPGRARRVVAAAETYEKWDPDGLSANCREQLRSACAVIYMAGGPLFDGKRHNRRDVEQETAGRIRGIDAVVQAFAAEPPTVFVAASSVGYYGYTHRSEIELDETSPAGTDWWGQSSAAIERAALAAQGRGVRTVTLRTGFVLTADSLAAQAARFRGHMGGWIGLGHGWTPWIHIADATQLIVAALEHQSYDGPLNATAPRPCRARAFARSLGQALDRRAWLAVPTPFARMGLGAVTDIVVKGKRVIPAKAIEKGFGFQFGNVDAALRDLVSQPKPR
jgi:uncharacterized protein (TIGR01777 family)